MLDTVHSPIPYLKGVATQAKPMLLIDGVRSSLDEIERLDPKTIENIEILKGAAAVATYGPDAQGGIITITMKKTLPPS